MHFSTLLTAASFAATAVEAAPRGAGFTRWLARQSHADREALRYREQRLEAEERHALHHRSYNQTNTTTIIRHPAPENDHAVTQLPIDDDGVVTIECSLPPVFVSTTTVDVTVFVTETPSAVPIVEETTTIEETESTSTVDREEETTPFVIVLPSSTVITEFVTTTSICDDGTETTIVLTQTTTEPCETTITDSSSMSTPVVPTLVLTPNITTSQSTPSVVTSTPGISTPSGSSSTPATVSSPSVSVTLPPDTTSASSSTTDCETDMTTPTPTPIATYDICIDINITPVITSKLTITATTPPEPTRTVCVDDHETGEPEEEALYCGVKGKPAGVYFLAEFIEERSGVPVTEEGCYQFCDSVMESTDGCQSYRFYHNELGAPRCALYGMPVASVVYDLDENQDDTWYDLACGSPSDESWSTVVPEESPKTTPATSSTSPTPVVSEAVTSETPTTSESLSTSVISEPTTTTTEPSTTSSVTPAPTPESDDDNVVNEPIDNSGTISDTGNVDSGNDMSDNQDSFNNNDNSGNSNSFNNNDNNDNNNNSGSLVDIDIGGLGN